jgi:hypothetical protein
MKNLFPLVCFLCASFQLSAQITDTSFVSVAKANAKKTLSKSIGMQSHLYSGPAYTEPRMTSDDQFPYYQSLDWLDGDIGYDGEIFKSVPILYSTFEDQVVTELPNGQKMRLLDAKINYFTIEGKLFIPIRDQKLKPGFYAFLYKGPTPVYGRYEKKAQERISGQTLTIDYEAKSKYFIMKNGIFFQVRSKRDVLNLLSDHKHELKQFASKNHLSFRKNMEKSIVTIAEFYDTL